MQREILSMPLAVGVLVAIAVGFAPTPASAAPLLLGQTVRWTYEFPTIGAAFDTQTFVVGAGVEVSEPFLTFFTADLSDTNILVSESGGFGAASFNGFHIFDLNSLIPSFTSVTINPSTDLAGFDASRITFDTDNIWVNLQGLTTPADVINLVSLDVNVPEPASLVLVGLGLFGVGARRWCTRKL